MIIMNLTEKEVAGINFCHNVLREIEEFRFSHESRYVGKSEEEIMAIIEDDVAYFEELDETVRNVLKEMPHHTFEAQTIRGMETFTMVDSEEVLSAFQSALIQVNFWLDGRRHRLEYKIRNFIKLC